MTKITSNKKSHFKTGGGPNEHQSISEMDETIIGVCSSGSRTLNVESFGSTRADEVILSDDDETEMARETEKENNSTKLNKKGSKEALPARPIPKAQLIQNQINSNESFQQKWLALTEKRNEIELEKLNLLLLEDKKNLLEYKLLKLEAKKSSNEIRQQKLDFLKKSY